MELRTRTVPTLEFYLPTSDTSLSGATYSFNGATPSSLSVSAPLNGVVTATLPYQESEGRVDIVWSFTVPGSGNHTLVEKHEVVTPLLTRREVLAVASDLTDTQADMLESNVRHIIQSLTGQSFGLFTGTYPISGRGRETLELPARLISLTTVNDSAVLDNFVIDADGYILRHYPWGAPPPIKNDIYGVNVATVGVMHDPRIYKLGEFGAGLVYSVAGKWGYEAVPESIKEAARILVNDYSCADIEYRDRYLTSMTAADWRIQFYNGAFSSTGNVRADQLIQPYIFKYKWLVL